MKSYEEFERRIQKSLNNIEAKISFLNDGVKGLSDAFKDFHEEITEFMAFSAENFSNHEKRISDLEKKVK